MLLDEEGEEEDENEHEEEEEEVTFKTSIVMPLNIYKNSNFTLTTRASNDQQVPPQNQQQFDTNGTSQSSPSPSPSPSSSSSLSHHAEFFLTNYSRAITLVDLCLFEYEHLQFAYSELAAAAFYLSLCQTTRQRRFEKSNRSGSCHKQPSTSSCCPFAMYLVERCTGMRWNDELERCVKWMRPYADVCDEMLTALDAQKRNNKQQQQPCPAVYDDEIDPDNVHNIQAMYNYRDWLVSTEI